jgi:hypothetical protein
MKIFRTFHTVRNGGSQAMHSLLLTLEERAKQNNGRLPHTLFLQVDGGAENSTKITIALCELLIAKGLCNKVDIIYHNLQYGIIIMLVIDLCFKAYGGTHS